MRVLGIAVDCNKNTDITQDAQNEETQKTGPHLSLYHPGGSDIDPCFRPGDSRQVFQGTDQHAAQQVPNPDDHKIAQITRQRVIKYVTGLPGKKVISPCTDGKQPDGKEEGPHYRAAGKGILHTQKDCAAQTDTEAGQDRIEKHAPKAAHRTSPSPDG